jgi:hypothetical protein
MSWYCALTEHLFKKENIIIGNESFAAVMEALEKEIVALYKALILYQMASANSYYRKQSTVLLRGLVNLDDWDGEFESVKNAEAAVERISVQYYREYEKSSLRQLVVSGQEMETLLSSIHLDLRDFIAQQKKVQMDDKLTKCLRDLYIVDPQDDMNNIERKKDILLNTSCNWIFSREEYAAITNWDRSDLFSNRLLWINGPAGTGKTMLLMGIIRELESHASPVSPKLAYFFYQGTGDKDLTTVTAALRSLLWLLLLQQPYLSHHLQLKYEYKDASLFSDRNAFEALFGVFRDMLQDPQLSPTYFIIDALDECSLNDQNQGLNEFLELISATLTLSTKVRWIVSSRPHVKLQSSDTTGSLVQLDPRLLMDPVNKYIDHKLLALEKKDGYNEKTLATVSRIIYQRANNTFLWVALVFKKLESIKGWHAAKIVDAIPPELNKLYEYMMITIENGEENDLPYCKNALVAALLAYRPLSLEEFILVAELSPDIDPQAIIDQCGSFLTVVEGTVSLVHQSAKDYLNTNYKSRLQPGGPAQGHADIYKQSITAISKLQKNIYSLKDFGLRPKDAQPPDPDPLSSLRYCCLFWADHFCDARGESIESRSTLPNNMILYQFLNNHLFPWLEGLSLLGRFPDSIHLIRKLLQKVCLKELSLYIYIR